MLRNVSRKKGSYPASFQSVGLSRGVLVFGGSAGAPALFATPAADGSGPVTRGGSGVPKLRRSLYNQHWLIQRPSLPVSSSGTTRSLRDRPFVDHYAHGMFWLYSA